MKLLFAGDIVYPYKNCVDINSIINIFENKTVIANLEGQILENDFKIIDKFKYNLYSDPSVIEILHNISMRYVSLANNHISDFKNDLNNTIQILEKNGIDYFGTKTKPSITINDRVKIYGIVANITGGIIKANDSVNRFDPISFLDIILNEKQKNPDQIIIIYIHWGYELAHYPQPADRMWAHKAIESGADFIIGHHPHVVQGIEKYKHGHIIYSIGNFILPQVSYLGHELKYFDNRVSTQLAVELDLDSINELSFYILNYNKTDNKIELIKKTNSINDEFILGLTPFHNMGLLEYKEWFMSQKRGKKIINTTPTYRDYFYMGGLQKRFLDWYLRFIWAIRKKLIQYKIHKPYNW